jgi:SpoVK/Ycf46/Vps4 family AAA+-type ATPase|mmetsp:Transcript_1108/g.1883  ORF Transcript_1108/g.1883 Transcript_1108/m.1883 type:complete len:496 (+) Transcript_1108:250-1737(+)
MVFSDELNLLLKARYPIIYVSSFEEDRLEYTIRKAIKANSNKAIYSWDFVDGYKTNSSNPRFASKNPLQALDLVEKLTEDTPAIFILKDFNKFLLDIAVSRKLRNLLSLLKTQPKTLIILATEIQIPKDLAEIVTILEFTLPTSKEIKFELIRLFKSLNKEIEDEFFELLISSCQGLSIEKIRRALSKSIAKYGSINNDTINFILKEKRQLISQTQLLEFIEPTNVLKDIGGLEILKEWLAIRKNSFTEKAKLYGLPAPRGLLLTGVQGTGKSLTAKAIANEWKLPLLRLDIGRLFGGLVGESEDRVRQMIILAEALAPCVLWVDEIDKAFADGQKTGDNGTTNRVLATFITWLSEKQSNVFVVATANNFFALPLELVRKGRFDEIFFVSLPTLLERKQIFQVFLNRFRPKTETVFDFNELGENSFGFSGAEIEQAIIDAMHIGFNEKREFTNVDILFALKQIIPLSQIDLVRSKKLQNLALSGRIRLASESTTG